MAREDQNKTPRTGGGDQNKSPANPQGGLSAPANAPGIQKGINPRNPRGGKSAPTEAPAPRSHASIPKNGDQYTPTSVKSRIVPEPPQPPKPSVDRGARR